MTDRFMQGTCGCCSLGIELLQGQEIALIAASLFGFIQCCVGALEQGIGINVWMLVVIAKAYADADALADV